MPKSAIYGGRILLTHDRPICKKNKNVCIYCTVTRGTLLRAVNTYSKIDPSEKKNWDVNILKSIRIQKLIVFFSLKVPIVIFY